VQGDYRATQTSVVHGADGHTGSLGERQGNVHTTSANGQTVHHDLKGMVMVDIPVPVPTPSVSNPQSVPMTPSVHAQEKADAQGSPKPASDNSPATTPATAAAALGLFRRRRESDSASAPIPHAPKSERSPPPFARDPAGIPVWAERTHEPAPSPASPVPAAQSHPAPATKPQRHLGDITRRFEAGKHDAKEACGVISTGKNDPGGKSYGTYQLASKTGTLNRFVIFYEKHAKEFLPEKAAEQFKGIPAASPEFDKRWKQLAETQPEAFHAMQHEFMKRTHYDPLVKHLEQKGFKDITPAMAESLWSTSVQHGRAKYIASEALKRAGKNADEIKFVTELFKQRIEYVNNLLDMPQKTKENILNRYGREQKAILEELAPRPKTIP
jgi:hypothetical protein